MRSILMANTTAGPQELRVLRLMDVDLTPQKDAPFGLITIQLGAKNEYRVRPLPLNQAAYMAAKELLNRAHDFGAVLPEHYLLPHRARKVRKRKARQPLTRSGGRRGTS